MRISKFIFIAMLSIHLRAYALTQDEEMGAAVLEPWARIIITDPATASLQYSTTTIQVNGTSVKEYTGLKPMGNIGTPTIRVNKSNESYEMNFGYSGRSIGNNVRMERFIRRGNTAVYTQCSAMGCLAVTPDICSNLKKDLDDSSASKLKECGDLLQKVGKYYDSSKIKLLTETEVANFNSSMPKGSRIDPKYQFSSAEIADSKLSLAIRRTALVIENCKKVEKTKFSNMLSPANLGGEYKESRSGAR